LYISCVIPARNEAGHLSHVVDEVLSCQDILDILIIEGGSTDDTYLEAVKIAQQNPNRIRVFKQEGKGKFNAVQLGASLAREEFFLIWDADGTVPLEGTREVIRHALLTGHATMGNRLKGVREKGAMQFSNFIGNWVFATLWAPLLNSKPADMLCGTKIVQTRVFTNIPPKLLKVDPYGDFALIATARHLGFPVHSVPVNYSARKYGTTNIKRWSGGISLLLTTIYVYVWHAKEKFRK
jgi:glycosyltransferase involved in cell wall biosynthesis